MYKLFILSAILATTYAAPYDYGHGGGHTLVALKPVKQVTVHGNAWNPWQQNNGWNNGWQQNNGWNPWQQSNGWNNAWQQNNAWNPWNRGYGSGTGHVVKVPVHHSPATSYAQVTSYNVHHAQPVVKAIVPTYAHDYGYQHGYGHGYHR